VRRRRRIRGNLATEASCYPAADVRQGNRRVPGWELVFAGIPARELGSLARVALEEAHRARGEIFMEGDAARWFYLVRSAT